MTPFQAMQIHPADNTATLVVDGKAGDEIVVAQGEMRFSIKLIEDVPFAHKAAVRAIEPGEAVTKYGEVMGRASAPIAMGAWVHVHNVESCRGRGDEAQVGDRGLKPEDRPDPANARRMTTAAPIFSADGREFRGYLRPDGLAGTRNLVGVLSTVVCANDVTEALGGEPGAAAFTHQQGCSQTRPDVEGIERTLFNLAMNPNLGGVLLVSLGCESVNAPKIYERIRAAGKPVEMIVIQEAGGKERALRAGREAIARLRDAIRAEPTMLPISRLRVGLKCGSSDTTQGISSNIIIGRMTEALVEAGAQVVIGETTEFMGAEHIAARHAGDDATAEAIVGAVERMENRARAIGVDMRGGQPTRGNIEGGLTTIEEKSLGALAKAGSAVFQEVVPYGVPSKKQGLVMMDSPGREPELLTGLAAMGCTIVVFATGRGAPQGFPFMPVVKITGNARTWERMREHMDVYVGDVISGEKTNEAAALDVFEHVLAAASGGPTAAERTGYFRSMNIYTTGPVI